MPTFYAVQISKEGFAGEVRINDVPLFKWLDGKSITTGQPVNMWITGRNGKVTVAFDWRNVPTGDIVPRPKISVKVLGGSQRNQPMNAAVELAHSAWQLDPNVLTRSSGLTLVEFSCDEVPPSAFWPQAQTLTLGSEAKANVLRLLHELNAALDRRDVTHVTALLQFKTVDVGQSLYHRESDSMKGLLEYLEFCMEGPNWGMEPIDDRSVQLELVADRRLIWATLPGEQPVLQARANRYPRLQLPIYVAPVSGRWTVVR